MVLCIHHNTTDSVPTSNLICIKMVFILNSQSRGLGHGGSTSDYHCEVITFSKKSLARLKEQAKSLAYKMFTNEIDFHALFKGILKVVFSFYSGVLHGKLADFPAKNIRCRWISSYVIPPRD